MLANKVAFILFDGYNSLDQTTEINLKSEAQTEDITVLSSSWLSKKSATRDMSIGQKGFLDDIAGGIWAQITAKGEGATGPFAIGLEGNTLGVRCIMSNDVFISNFQRLPIKSEISKFETDYTTTGEANAFADGLILYPLSATSGTTGSGAYIDLGSANINTITSSAISNPCSILTSVAHNLKVGDTVVIVSHTGSTPTLNGTWSVVGVPDTTHFQIPVNCTTGGTGGTATLSSGGMLVVQMPSITSVPTLIVFQLTDCDTTGGSYTDVAGATVSFSGSPVTPPDGLSVAFTGTVRRYAKLKWTFTGGTTPTATVLAALKRN
jgi:hypothetical protein